jgi:hypothetical protein
MEKAQRGKDRKMGTAEEKGKEQINPLVRKRAGKRANVNRQQWRAADLKGRARKLVPVSWGFGCARPLRRVTPDVV